MTLRNKVENLLTTGTSHLEKGRKPSNLNLCKATRGPMQGSTYWYLYVFTTVNVNSVVFQKQQN